MSAPAMSDPLGEATGAVTSKAPGNGPGGVLSRWVFALKPQSWPKLLVPAALGQALGVAHTERWSWPPLIVGVLFTVFGGAFIVLANDWADQGVDRLKRDMFPAAGSPKTIPDGVLGERSVAKGAAVAAGFAASVAVLGALWLSVTSLAWLGLGGIAVFAAYSLPPLRLNYRGGGEFLEAFGVGVVLPLFNAVAQGGSPANWAAAMALPGFSCLALASALASGLSDEESDRAGGKRTVAVHFGSLTTRHAVWGACLAGALAWVLAAWAFHSPAPLVPSLLVLSGLPRLWNQGRTAGTGAFGALSIYKRTLHRTIWRATLFLTVVVFVWGRQ